MKKGQVIARAYSSGSDLVGQYVVNVEKKQVTKLSKTELLFFNSDTCASFGLNCSKLDHTISGELEDFRLYQKLKYQCIKMSSCAFKVNLSENARLKIKESLKSIFKLVKSIFQNLGI